MTIELRHLRYFVAVAEELHFGRAAQRLRVAQPPLSQQIQALEARLGVRLLERTRRKVELTDAGRLFLDEARKTLGQAEHAVDVAQRAARGKVGRLEIGFTGSAPFIPVMPRLIGLYRAVHPEVQLALRELPSTAQIEALTERRLDIGFIRPGRDTAIPGILTRHLVREPLLAVLNKDHPLAAQKVVRIADLADQPFILHPRPIGTGLYDKIQQLCGSEGFTPRGVIEANQMSTIVSLAAVGLGLSLVPAALRRMQAEGVVFRPLDREDAYMDLLLAFRDSPSPLVQSFLDSVPATLPLD